MHHRRPSAVVASPALIALSVGRGGTAAPAGGTYIDPHLVVLLFLLGFCLLYAAVLAVDAMTRRRSADPTLEE